jgi:hypothetical protein
MDDIEERLEYLERKVQRLEEELGTFLTTVLITPPDRPDILAAAAELALENLKAAA